MVRSRPSVCVAHQLDVLPLALFLRAISPRMKVVLDNEDVYSLMVSRGVPGLLRSIIRSVERALASRADLCIFPNLAMRDYTLPAGGGDSIIVPNVPEREFELGHTGTSQKPNIDHEGFRVTYFGLITRFRGLESLIRAVVRVIAQGGNVSCLLIGDGPLVKELKDISSKNGIINKVQFTGRVSRESIPRLVSACDASAILNSRKDPMNVLGDPNKLYESMILGVPVIASNFGEISIIVKESNCGVLVDPDDEKSIAEAIVRLSNDPDFRDSLSRNGKEFMRTKYSWVSIEHRLVEAIDRLAFSI